MQPSARFEIMSDPLVYFYYAQISKQRPRNMLFVICADLPGFCRPTCIVILVQLKPFTLHPPKNIFRN